MGRIGLAVAPSKPDVRLRGRRSANKAGGFLPLDRPGGTWEKRSSYVAGSPQYYNELFVDPKIDSRVYAMDTWMQVSEDGGKTFTRSVSSTSTSTTTCCGSIRPIPII